MTTYTRIRRTIQQLLWAYPEQKVYREDAINCLNCEDFQTKYVNYGT